MRFLEKGPLYWSLSHRVFLFCLQVIQERTKAPCIGRISFPVGNSGVQPGVHAITLRPNELQELHYVMVK